MSVGTISPSLKDGLSTFGSWHSLVRQGTGANESPNHLNANKPSEGDRCPEVTRVHLED